MTRSATTFKISRLRNNNDSYILGRDACFASVSTLLIFVMLILSACGSTPTQQSASTDGFTANPSATAFLVPTGTLTPTRSIPPPLTGTLLPTTSPTPTTTDSPTFTPAPLPVFTHRLIRTGVLPRTYLAACEYLRLRWSPEASEPGTVVVPVMFHGIRGAGKNILEGDDTTITEEQFQLFVNFAKNNGFQTITVAQLADFLLHNARIPPRSLLMIIDDRRPGTVENYFLPVVEDNNWTVTLGWIIGDTDAELWSWMERLNASGRLDVQSHGYHHLYITDQTPEKDIRRELFDPILLLEQHFGHRPTAFVWPGGNFTTQSVALAHEAGYTLGFTAFSRGPLMFNWVPQGPEEWFVGDPLMTLPRAWSTDLTLPLDVAIQINKTAQAEAQASFAQEAAYYRLYCGGELGQSVYP